MSYLWVLIGGGAGSLSRYAMSKMINQIMGTTFPMGTMAVNMIGCLIIGFVFGFFERVAISPNVRLFIITGFLGGFTTFSSYCLETINLIKEQETGHVVLNILISNVIGLILVYVGMFLAQILFSTNVDK